MDGTPNKQGTIRYYVNLNIEIHRRKWKEQLLVTGLGKHRIILGLPWLRKTNPIIDWEKGTLEWRNPKLINSFEMARKLAKQAINYSLVVFKGLVHWTKKMTKTRLDRWLRLPTFVVIAVAGCLILKNSQNR